MSQLQYRICPVTPFVQNCSLIWCSETRRAAFVDPGGEAERLIQELETESLQLEKIILTHGHLDHVGATGALAARLDVPVEGPHEDDLFWIEALDEQSKYFGFPRVEHFRPNRWLKQGDQVTVGKHTLEVRHTPGHTPGHIVLVHEPSKMIWVGDVLFQGSIGRTDFPQGNHQQLLESIRQQLWSLEEDFSFVPGHGPMSTIGEEKRSNPFLQ
jgi:glyoxylase-like metal-dependent hydrolase (beta-lactamase superfamily II)